MLFGSAGAAADNVDAAKILYVLRNTKAIKPDMPLNATVVQREAIVLTARSAKATDKDCKIDAVLISKELFAAFPDQISRIKILFSMPGTNLASQIEVTAGDVKAFAVGAMDVNALLSSLELTNVDSGSGAATSQAALTIVPGALADKRLMLLSRIEGLRSKGTSVKPFKDIFDRIEGEVTSASSEQLSKDVAYLGEKLSEQENLVRQAASRPVRSSAVGGGSLNASYSGDAARLELRCQEWNTKLDRWRKEGRDVAQLIASIAVTRMLLADRTPESMHKASATLDGLDFLFKNGPPP